MLKFKLKICNTKCLIDDTNKNKTEKYKTSSRFDTEM